MAAEAKKLRAVTPSTPAKIRCGIYTRKSTDEGLDRDFNSLDAQREAGESFVTSQRQEGWTALPERYDDGGYTGGNMDRPALRRLLADVEAGKLDCVVVYKLDRLTRAMKDFFKIMEILDRHHVTFVSVTQQFNTTTSIGRLALNIVMSFAEFERETIADRTRDKMRAARRKGKWIGGYPILGYDIAPKGGAIIVNASEAERVREIFRLYLKLGSLIRVLEELERCNWRMKAWITREGIQRGGSPFSKTTLHGLLTNVVYIGKVKFEGKLFDGEHERIVDDELFQKVQDHLHRNASKGERKVRNKNGALLKGLVQCGSCGGVMIHTYVQKKNKRYLYYVCAKAHQRGWNKCATRLVSAPELEGAVVDSLRNFARDPGVLSEVLQRIAEARQPDEPIADPADVQAALLKFDPLWEQLTTLERETFIRSLVAQVKYDGTTGDVTIGFRSEGIKELCSQNGASG